MIEKDSRPVVGEYVFLSKYSQTHDGKKETWQEAVDRVMDMHLKRYSGMVKPEHEAEFSQLLQERTASIQSSVCLVPSVRYSMVGN